MNSTLEELRALSQKTKTVSIITMLSIIGLCLLLVICAGFSDAKSSNVTPAKIEEQWIPLTNDQIIDETNKCKLAGLNVEGLYRKDKGAEITRVQCIPV